MRLKINFTKNNEKVPNNQNIVNSYIHTKCLGHNEYHDKQSNYCISRMLGGVVNKNGKTIDYEKGGYILITSLDLEFLNKIVLGVLTNPMFGYGMELVDIERIEEEFYSGVNHFKTTPSGFVLRKKDGIGKDLYYTIEDPNINKVLEEHIYNKFTKINPNLNFEGFKIEVVNHKSNRIRNLLVKDVVNVSNICQINMYGDRELAKYIYHYGIGQSCGSGFGTVFTTQYKNKYD